MTKTEIKKFLLGKKEEFTYKEERILTYEKIFM